MKPTLRAVFFSFFALSLVACTGPRKTAGIQDEGASIGDSVVLVETNSSPKEAYRSAAQTLQEHGFLIESSDASLLRITTTPKQASDIIAPVDNLRLEIQVEESSDRSILRLSGTYSDGFTIEKRGQSGSSARKAWKAMHQVAGYLGAVAAYR